MSNIDLFTLTGAIAIKGDNVATGKTITIGQQVTFSDVLVVDTATIGLTAGGALTLSAGLIATTGNFSGALTGTSATWTGDHVFSADADIKGDNVAGRTITIGQQVTFSDVLVVDTATCGLTAGGALTLSAGLIATTGTFSGLLGANAGLTGTTAVMSGLITANAGLSGTTGVFSGQVNANGGITAPGGGSGGDCEVFGVLAGSSLTTGSGATCVGDSAGLNITEGSNNICIGKNSGTGIVAGLTNVCIGSNTLTAIDGTDLIAIGDGALRYSEGSNNLGIGKAALAGSQVTAHTGEFNVAIGTNTLLVAEGALSWNNTAIGGNSLTALTVGFGNTCIGKDTGKAITTGANNLFLGNGTGDLTDTGDNNIFLGGDVQGTGVGVDDELKIHRNNADTPILYGIMGAASTNQLGVNTQTLNAMVTMQTDVAHAMPVLELEQADTDDSFINYVGTSAASAANSISSLTTPGIPAGFTLNEVNGAAQWVQVFDAPSTPEATLAAAVTTFVANGSYMEITGDAGANTVVTVTGGVKGMLLTLKFVDALVTITDTAAATADTINLSAAFTSTADDTMQLVHDGNKWFETSRSVN